MDEIRDCFIESTDCDEGTEDNTSKRLLWHSIRYVSDITLCWSAFFFFLDFCVGSMASIRELNYHTVHFHSHHEECCRDQTAVTGPAAGSETGSSQGTSCNYRDNEWQSLSWAESSLPRTGWNKLHELNPREADILTYSPDQGIQWQPSAISPYPKHHESTRTSSQFFKIYSNIRPKPTPRFFKWSFPSILRNKFLYFSFLP